MVWYGTVRFAVSVLIWRWWYGDVVFSETLAAIEVSRYTTFWRKYFGNDKACYRKIAGMSFSFCNMIVLYNLGHGFSSSDFSSFFGFAQNQFLGEVYIIIKIIYYRVVYQATTLKRENRASAPLP